MLCPQRGPQTGGWNCLAAFGCGRGARWATSCVGGQVWGGAEGQAATSRRCAALVLVPLTVVTKEQSLALLPDLPHDPPNLWVEETAYEGRVSSLRACSWPPPWPIVAFNVLAAPWEVSGQIVELLRGRCGRSSAKKSDFGSCYSLSIAVVPGHGPWGGAGSAENCQGYLGHGASEGQSPLLRA